MAELTSTSRRFASIADAGPSGPPYIHDMRCNPPVFFRAALVAGALPFMAGAQAVRGTVVLPDGRTPAAGVIVTATGDSGRVGRALTGDRGAYLITLPSAGRYVVRALRVGYQPTTSPPVTIGGRDTAWANLTLSGVAISLGAVTVRGEDVCRVRPDSGALVAQAWEEARKAILASQLASADAPLVAEWIEYDRTLDPSGRIVRGLKVRSTTSPTTHAFRSVPAESLATHGYVVPQGEETTYHAPDGDALLSDSFAATHCFQVVRPARGADSLIGVAFRPAKDRRDFRDIEGAFWLDRRSAELRWMEYRYTSMPDVVAKAEAGGRVDYLRLGTGSWLIGKWSIRMPVARRAGTVADAGTRRVIRQPNALELDAVRVTGGEVTAVHRADSLLYRAAGAAFEVVATTRDSTIERRGAEARLLGTDYTMTLDSTGRGRVTPVLEGRYELRLSTPLMDSLRIEPVRREVEVSVRARVDTVRLPTREQLLASACRDSAKANEAMLRGFVRDSAGRTVGDAAVTATWQGSFRLVGASTDKDRNLGWTDRSVGALTDSTGAWRICGVPRELPVVIRASRDLMTDARRVRLGLDDAIANFDLALHRTAPPVDRQFPDSMIAVVELVVTNGDGLPLPDVRLDLEIPGVGSRTVTTGATGRTLVADARAGRIVVTARRIGFLPGKVSAAVAPGRNTIPIILGEARLPALDTVRIVGDRRVFGLDRLDEFEDRRLNKLATRTITRQEIEKRNPTEAWQMLTNVPALRISDRGDGKVVATMTRAMVQNFSNAPCYPRVIVDGVLVQEDAPPPRFGAAANASPDGPVAPQPTDLSRLPPPDAIYGIEVFAGPASIPLQYGGSGNGKWCGLIAIWTK